MILRGALAKVETLRDSPIGKADATFAALHGYRGWRAASPRCQKTSAAIELGSARWSSAGR